MIPHPENKRYLLGGSLSGGTDHLSQFGGDNGLNLGTQIELSGGFREGGDIGILTDDDPGILDLLELSGLIGRDGGALLLAAKKADRKTRFAFGPFLCIGIAAAMFFGERLADWYIGLL